MVTRRTPVKRPRTRAAVTAPPVLAGYTAKLGPARNEARARVEASARRLRQLSRATGRFASNSAQELAAAAKACRTPVRSIWRNFATAGRNIARDATAVWQQMVRLPLR